MKQLKKAAQNIKIRSNIPFLMIYAGVFGYVLILCLFFYEEIFLGSSSIHSYSSTENFFNNNPGYLLWISSILIQPVIWLAFIFPASFIILNLKNELKDSKNIWFLFILLLIAFVIFIVFNSLTVFKYFVLPQSPFVNHIFKLQAFTLIGQLTGLYYMFGAILVSKVSLKNINLGIYDILTYRTLKNNLGVVLNFTGIIFSIGVISAFLLHRAINDVYAYPIEFVISLGVMNSLIILLIYLPVNFSLQYYGRQILENKFKLKNGETATEIEVLKKHDEELKSLELSFGLTQTFKTAFVILSPIISSLIPKVVGL